VTRSTGRWLGAVFATSMLASTAAGAAAPIRAMPLCGMEIATKYEVPHDLLHAIRNAEGGTKGASQCALNKDKSCDHGLMQINDGWFGGGFGINLLDYKITKAAVRDNDCQNVAVGAWVLKMNYDATRNWFGAVAAYNVGMRNRNGAVGWRYASRVFDWWDRISGVKHPKPAAPAGSASAGTSVATKGWVAKPEHEAIIVRLSSAE